ncbi:MAG: hypothetical protein WA080_01215 [Sulfuricurvum sp.]
MKIVILDALTYDDTALEAFYELGEVSVYATTSSEETLERVRLTLRWKISSPIQNC